jgi:hydrogenase/urease accessory protein HupE
METPPGINHMDDVVLLSYGLAGIVLCCASHRELRVRGILVPFLLGFAALAIAIFIDARAPVEGIWPHIEEPVETAGAAFFLVGFVRRLRWSLSDAGYFAAEPAAPAVNVSRS